MSIRWLVFACVLVSSNVWSDTRAQYILHCGGCHLPDGRGAPPEVPSLRGDLGHIVGEPGGREYLVQVPGASQAPVSDAVLTRIINWVLAEFNADTLAPGFKPLSTAEVSRARKTVLPDPLKTRAKLWKEYD